MSSRPGSDLSQEAASGSERRRRMRFPLRASCFFSWNSRESGLTFGTGWTLDLSSDGICLSAERIPRPGEKIFVEVSFPAGPVSCDVAHRADAESGTIESGTTDGGAGDCGMEGAMACGEGLVIWADAKRSKFAAELCFYFYGRPTLSSLQAPA